MHSLFHTLFHSHSLSHSTKHTHTHTHTHNPASHQHHQYLKVNKSQQRMLRKRVFPSSMGSYHLPHHQASPPTHHAEREYIGSAALTLQSSELLQLKCQRVHMLTHHHRKHKTPKSHTIQNTTVKAALHYPTNWPVLGLGEGVSQFRLTPREVGRAEIEIRTGLILSDLTRVVWGARSPITLAATANET